MDAKAAIKSNMNLSTMVLKAYIGDLESADLMRRPGEECNHLAWQLGHLISSEVQLLQGLAQSANSLDPDSVAAGVDLPAGFAEKHSKENITSDDASAFHSKEEYEALFDASST